MSPSRANGLQFVAVVVVESHAIVESLERGDRLLYIALTRTTKYLTVVLDKVIPPFGVPSDDESEPLVATEAPDDKLIEEILNGADEKTPNEARGCLAPRLDDAGAHVVDELFVGPVRCGVVAPSDPCSGRVDELARRCRIRSASRWPVRCSTEQVAA